MMKLSDIKPVQSTLRNPDQIESMVDTLQLGGSLPPILLTTENYLLNGHHRLEAYKRAGRQFLYHDEYVIQDGWLVEENEMYGRVFKRECSSIG